MTTEQLAKANELNRKIKEAKTFVANLEKSNNEVEAAKALPTGLSVSYLINSTGKRFEFNPSWIADETIRKDALNAIDNTKDTLLSCMKAYVGVMEKELETI